LREMREMREREKIKRVKIFYGGASFFDFLIFCVSRAFFHFFFSIFTQTGLVLSSTTHSHTRRRRRNRRQRQREEEEKSARRRGE